VAHVATLDHEDYILGEIGAVVTHPLEPFGHRLQMDPCARRVISFLK
jgi:hypothetical protein